MYIHDLIITGGTCRAVIGESFKSRVKDRERDLVGGWERQLAIFICDYRQISMIRTNFILIFLEFDLQ